jgi:3-deoxy-D-manno-octulosonic-acid transferase
VPDAPQSTAAKVAGAGAPPCIWLHAPLPEAEPAAALLARRLAEGAAELSVLRTGPADPADPSAIAALIARNRPRLAVVLGGAMPPALAQVAAVRGVPLLMAGASAAMAPALAPAVPEAGGRGWLARLLGRRSVAAHRASPPPALPGRALVTDAEAEAAFAAAGMPRGAITITGPLEEPSRAARVNEAERAALARAMGTRPAWLAIGLPEAEDDLVAAAHRFALRGAHRLLLVIVPDDPARGAALAARLADRHGFAVARRGAEQDPDPDTEVYVADTDGEEGLWLRLAPTVWIGGSGSAGATSHPFAAAAAGAAILHGSAPGRHGAAFARLQAGGASREVTDASALGAEVSELLAPDVAARMARAAWEVCSAGAETTERLLAIAAEALEPALAAGGG